MNDRTAQDEALQNSHAELLAACKMALVQIKQDNDERKVESCYRLTEWQVKSAIENAKATSD